MENFVYSYPVKLLLENGTSLALTRDDMKDERYLAIRIPESSIDPLSDRLKSVGFRKAVPSWDQGETYGLSKPVNGTWEMHVRVFPDGSIYSHVEIRRDFFQHLNERYVWPVYDEALELARAVAANVRTVHVKSDSQVSRILAREKVTLAPPSRLTGWKPVAYFAGGIIAGTIAYYSISKIKQLLGKGKNQ